MMIYILCEQFWARLAWHLAQFNKFPTQYTFHKDRTYVHIREQDEKKKAMPTEYFILIHE